jgi:hypothetical protein
VHVLVLTLLPVVAENDALTCLTESAWSHAYATPAPASDSTHTIVINRRIYSPSVVGLGEKDAATEATLRSGR